MSFLQHFHHIFEQLGWHSDLDTNKLFNVLWLASVHIAVEIMPQKEVQRGQIWTSRWPYNITISLFDI